MPHRRNKVSLSTQARILELHFHVQVRETIVLSQALSAATAAAIAALSECISRGVRAERAAKTLEADGKKDSLRVEKIDDRGHGNESHGDNFDIEQQQHYSVLPPATGVQASAAEMNLADWEKQEDEVEQQVQQLQRYVSCGMLLHSVSLLTTSGKEAGMIDDFKGAYDRLQVLYRLVPPRHQDAAGRSSAARGPHGGRRSKVRLRVVGVERGGERCEGPPGRGR